MGMEILIVMVSVTAFIVALRLVGRLIATLLKLLLLAAALFFLFTRLSALCSSPPPRAALARLLCPAPVAPHQSVEFR